MEVVLKSNDEGAELALRDVSGSQHGIRFDLWVRSRSFTGSLPQTLESVELQKFVGDLRQMHQTLQGSAELRTHGDEDGATFTMDRLGGVAVNVVLVHYQQPRHRLEVGFRSDQSCLPAFIDDLVAAGKAFGSIR